MPDVFDKCLRFQRKNGIVSEEDREIAARSVYRESPLDSAGPWLKLNGRHALQFSSNDYLGLANHPDVRAAATKVVAEFGISAPMGARAMTGNTQLHVELERQVAAFKRTEKALVFSTGSDAMMGAVAALAGRRDLIILDEYAHASLTWGAKVSGADVEVFQHNNVEELESILSEAPRKQAKMVVVNGVYSMHGDLAPLPELSELCKANGARLLVDDAHGTGVCGDNGRGTAELFGVEDQIDLHLGTFSKAVGTAGGFAAGDQAVIDFLKYRAPSILFTKAMPACIAAGTLEALKLVRDSQDRRNTLWRNAELLQNGMQAAGYSIGNTQTPITPVHAKGSAAIYLSDAMDREFNIRTSAILYPAVPFGTSVLRITPTANHCRTDIQLLLKAASKIRETIPLEFVNNGRTRKCAARL